MRERNQEILLEIPGVLEREWEKLKIEKKSRWGVKEAKQRVDRWKNGLFTINQFL